MSILLSGELEVDGNLKVTGTIQNDSLAQVIANLQAQITALQAQVAHFECINSGNIPAGYCDCYGNVLDICGICAGNAISEEECEIDYALSFDGDNDWVDIGLLNGMNPTGSFTFSFELYNMFTENDPYVISGYGDLPTCNKSFFIGANSDCSQCMSINFYHHPNCNNGVILFGPSLFNDIWSHWAISYDSNTLQRQIYYNGVLMAADISGADYQGNMEIMLGAVQLSLISGNGYYEIGQFLRGELDNFAVYDYCLTQEEVNNNMDNGPIGTEMGYWNFNEAFGDTLFDTSGNGNFGIIHGGAQLIER